MKHYLSRLAAVLAVCVTVGCATHGPEQRCRDKSDATASISYDYCIWNQKQLTSNDRERTPGEWNSIVVWPSAQQRMPASIKDRDSDRRFR